MDLVKRIRTKVHSPSVKRQYKLDILNIKKGELKYEIHSKNTACTHYVGSMVH